MNKNTTDELVQEIMLDFARLTGLEPAEDHPRRYLWTDSFAVCNYLELYSKTSVAIYRDLALHLVDQVHHTLGQHRDDDSRNGWISGLSKKEGERQPTIGGLRIGKKLNERMPDDPLDERLEWDRDGQYYHYLTKWMHALNCVGQDIGDPSYTKWAIELAKTAHSRFVSRNPYNGRKRIFWKMSIDLSYPLVPSMGQHDALDGFVTYSELRSVAAEGSSFLDLEAEIADMAEICHGINLVTDDPLGIGGLLVDASRIAQLIVRGGLKNSNLLENVVNSALTGAEDFVNGETLECPAKYRLAFRELGLSIGLSAAESMLKLMKRKPTLFNREMSLQRCVEDLVMYLPLRGVIERFWMEGTNREASTWIDHREINMVMLATSLTPNRFLTI